MIRQKNTSLNKNYVFTLHKSYPFPPIITIASHLKQTKEHNPLRARMDRTTSPPHYQRTSPLSHLWPDTSTCLKIRKGFSPLRIHKSDRGLTRRRRGLRYYICMQIPKPICESEYLFRLLNKAKDGIEFSVVGRFRRKLTRPGPRNAKWTISLLVPFEFGRFEEFRLNDPPRKAFRGGVLLASDRNCFIILVLIVVVGGLCGGSLKFLQV